MTASITVNGGSSTARVFNVNDFRTQVTDGFIRNSSFIMDVGTPPGLIVDKLSNGKTTEYTNTLKKLRFYIESSTLPGIGLATTEIKRYGHGNVTLRPYAPIFDVVDMIVRMDAGGSVYEFFQSWMKLVLNSDTNLGMDAQSGFKGAIPFEVNYKSDYASQASITAFDDEGDAKVSLTLKDAYPIYLGPISASWADGNNVMKFAIKMTFNQWYNGSNVTSPGSELPIQDTFF